MMKGCFSFDVNGLRIADDKTIRKVNICNNELFYYSKNDKELNEVNDDLIIIESKNSFWETIEYELKIDIEDVVDIVVVLNGLSKILSAGYSISNLDYQKSFEKHYEICKNSEVFHVVKLGKKGWKLKQAIKTKQTYDKLGRKVSIKPYTANAWRELLQGIESIKEYPVFYKDKYRYILVNRAKGTVYGLSVSKTEFVSKKHRNKCEIEVEYWSDLLPLGGKHSFDHSNEKELYEIIDIVKCFLLKSHINYRFPGVRKSEWFRDLYQRERF